MKLYAYDQSTSILLSPQVKKFWIEFTFDVEFEIKMKDDDVSSAIFWIIDESAVGK
jgi:hypothetical protein